MRVQRLQTNSIGVFGDQNPQLVESCRAKCRGVDRISVWGGGGTGRTPKVRDENRGAGGV